MSTIAAADADALRKSVTFYASFDEAVRGDFGGGGLTPGTRFGPPGEWEKYRFEKGFDERVFRIAAGKGLRGGALEVVDVLPDGGRIYFPARGNLAYRKGGWGGAVSFWMNTDPNRLLKTPFCDPVQITHRGANNGGIWCDFTAAKPRRDFRLGAFPAAPPDQKPLAEDAPGAPLVRVPAVDFRAGDWHHVVLTWRNFDTARPDARATLYLDGRRVGDVTDRPIAMDWDIEKAGIFVAVNYIGLLDEFATFGRELTADEVEMLHRDPGLLAGLKKR
jgi:hypothetical protein